MKIEFFSERLQNYVRLDLEIGFSRYGEPHIKDADFEICGNDNEWFNFTPGHRLNTAIFKEVYRLDEYEKEATRQREAEDEYWMEKNATGHHRCGTVGD